MRICISAILLAFLIMSCGAAHKLRKAKELIAEAEADGAKVKTDTVYKDKVIKVKGDSTFVFVPVHKDTTIYVLKDRIKIKEVFKHDTIFQSIKCPDTVLKSKQPISVNQSINCPPPNNFWKWVALTSTAILMLTIYMLIKRI